MKTYLIKNSHVEVGITEDCGHLFPVKFILGDKVIEPMHIAPWADENLDPSIPPMLKMLRGDFFCAPFGDSDLMEDETRGHGSSANDLWVLTEATNSSMKFKLFRKILGSELTKEITIHENEQVVYQKHIFQGGEGNIPVGHHAMIKVKSKAYLSFSDFSFAGTPPKPIEPDPISGRSILKYPQKFSELTSIKLNDNSFADASVYPFNSNHEDLFMVISKKDTIGWSALSCPDEGWVWFSIKNTKVLPNTVIWLSNGGRNYPPFSSRHNNVIGIEETASYFHLGHKASVDNNELNSLGYKTYIELHPDKTIEIPYLFGAAKIPGSFGKVKSITEVNEGIEITDYNGNSVQTNVNINFIKDAQ